MATALELVKDAFIASGMKDYSEGISADEYQFGLSRLNGIRDLWATQQQLCKLTTLTATIPAGSSYTIEPSGDINAETPAGIEQAFVRIGNLDYALDILSADEYFSDSTKLTATSPPTGIYYKNGILYVLPALSGSVEIHLVCRSPNRFATISTDLEMTSAEYDATYLSLAERLCVGVKEVNKTLAMSAKQARDMWRASNVRVKNLGMGTRGGYDIVTGRFR